MAQSESLSVGIEKLKDGNFATWKFQMKHYLILKGYFISIVDGSEEKPEDSAAENAKQAFKQRSEQAFSILV